MAAGRDWRGLRQRLLFALLLGVALAAVSLTPFGRYLERLSIDLLLPLRHHLLGPLFPPDESRTAVVAIDEQTYRTAPFSATPKVAWTPHLGRVIEALDAAGATVIGIDVVFPTTLDRPDLLQGYDRPLLQALLRAGRAGRLVLGEVRLSADSIRPYAGQLLAAGRGNVRLLNLLFDADDVVRRYPGSFALDGGGRITSFAAELARRAGAPVPAAEFLINYNTGPGDVPTFSFADLWHCAAAGRSDFFARHFRGRVVLIGEALDVEDRRTPAKRFVLPRDTAASERCVVAAEPERYASLVERRTIPGVYVHAAAVNTLVAGRPLQLFPAPASAAMQAVWAVALAALFFAVPPLGGAAGAAVLAFATLGVAVFAFSRDVVPPVVNAVAAVVIVFALTYAYRFVVEDRQKRWIQTAFRHYLAPALVDRLARDPASLRLGGQRRRITVFFSDIAGFTSISEEMRDRPELLVEILNQYLTVMTAAVGARGGYVDKFIGDAVMALWNAPLDDPNAERNAVEAALDCMAALDRFNREVMADRYGLPPIGTRIGLGTGVAIVGNMGSASRLNYTATGDIVNLAARLEGANKAYGSRIMISEDTARGLGRDILLRRLDRLVVKGKSMPVKVYEVVGRLAEVDAATGDRIGRFHAALGQYYRHRFAAAEAAFAALAADDPVAALYRDRAAQYRLEPPAGRSLAYALRTK